MMEAVHHEGWTEETMQLCSGSNGNGMRRELPRGFLLMLQNTAHAMEVLTERSSGCDVHRLHAFADAEHRKPHCKRLLYHLNIEEIDYPHRKAQSQLGLLPIEIRSDIIASGKDEAIDVLKNGEDILSIAKGRYDDRDSPCSDDGYGVIMIDIVPHETWHAAGFHDKDIPGDSYERFLHTVMIILMRLMRHPAPRDIAFSPL